MTMRHHAIVMFTFITALPFSIRWLSLIMFFTGSILVRPHYVDFPTILNNFPEGDSGFSFPGNHKVTLALYELGREQVIFGCGFYCGGIGCKIGSYTFSIFIIQNPAIGNFAINGDVEPQVLWSANRESAFGINATLEFTMEGDLVVKDAKGFVSWSAGTSGKSVVALNLTDRGNLVLLDRYNKTIWQSFYHPTDTLLLGQILRVGQKLTQSFSPWNWTDGGGTLSVSLTTEGLLATVESNSGPPPLSYYSVNFSANASGLFHLDACRYPNSCGHYGLCSNGSCSCMISSDNMTYFHQSDRKHPNQGCSLKTPLICGVASNKQTFIEVANVEYFNFFAHLTDVDLETCKDTCLKNCSCKAVFYRVSPANNRRWCFLPSEVFSLINSTERNDGGISYTTAYIKIQNDHHDISSAPPSYEATGQKEELDTFTKMNNFRILLTSFFAAAMTAAILVALFVQQKKKKRTKDVSIEEYVDQIQGLPARFTYAELEEIKEKFSKKLGEGGFGSVYEGVLLNKTKVAVKCVDGFEHTKKSFLTEVKTIGSIHHARLVRLLGFCANNSYRLLVYEYMSNGSLDKWIFNKLVGCTPPKWEQRRNIILDVAKGLHYLHEECTLKIVHFDIKPQNILLDENSLAKVSDFGMSKLIDRDQSCVVTAMRGTRGYLAPEWLNGVISEKVDVYSFGVVVLEIVCGRKAFSQSDKYGETNMDLLDLLKRKSEEGCLSEMVDRKIDDVDKASAKHVLKIAAWCLQVDPGRRPSMSMVIKVLEGAIDVREDEISYDFKIPSTTSSSEGLDKLGIILNANANAVESAAVGGSSPLLASVLSGPR